MKVLAINCGSSTLKFKLLEVEAEGTRPQAAQRLAAGVVARIGGPATIEFTSGDSETVRESAEAADHGEAARLFLEWLSNTNIGGPDAVGHRVVHGGIRLAGPVLIDSAIMKEIEAVSHLAPLHNGPSLEAIRATRLELGPSVPMVATFDTAFHRGLPERASHYAIPLELAERHGVYRYGFHGLAHRYMAERYSSMTSTAQEQAKLITLQLGNGCSAAAIDGGRSIDTSMGFTPLEGLVMGTRSGDIDASVLSYLARREGVPSEEVEGWLNTTSGLLGISGRSPDMGELLDAERQGDARATLAVELFCYRTRKYVGAYLAALGGADALVFGGGIGENAPVVRTRICEDLDWLGLTLDPDRNERAIGAEGRISTDGSRIQAYVVAVDEESVIGQDTARCLQGRSQG